MRLHLLVLVCAVLLVGCGGSSDRTSAELLVPEERPEAPEVVATTVDGEELALADLSGPVVVNFWASWCGPCVGEAPELAEIAAAYGEHDVTVVGVNVRDSEVNAERFETDLAIPFPSWYDPSSQIAASFGGIGPAALPSTLILDADHRVAVRLFGGVTFSQVQGYLEPLLAESGRVGLDGTLDEQGPAS